MRTFRYKDGTVQRIKVLGISDLETKISWTLVSSFSLETPAPLKVMPPVTRQLDNV